MSAADGVVAETPRHLMSMGGTGVRTNSKTLATSMMSWWHTINIRLNSVSTFQTASPWRWLPSRLPPLVSPSYLCAVAWHSLHNEEENCLLGSLPMARVSWMFTVSGATFPLRDVARWGGEYTSPAPPLIFHRSASSSFSLPLLPPCAYSSHLRPLCHLAFLVPSFIVQYAPWRCRGRHTH